MTAYHIILAIYLTLIFVVGFMCGAHIRPQLLARILALTVVFELMKAGMKRRIADLERQLATRGNG